MYVASFLKDLTCRLPEIIHIMRQPSEGRKAEMRMQKTNEVEEQEK